MLELEHYLSIGSNIEPERNIPAALRQLETLGRVSAVSSVYRTAPVGSVDQPDFHNLVLCLSSGLSPLFVLERCGQIEQRLGRRRTTRWGPRTLDLDLLLCRPRVRIEHPRLEVPHPRLQQRAFVLVPLLEIAGALCGAEHAELREAARATSEQRIERLGPLHEIYPAAARGAAGVPAPCRKE